MDLQSAPSQYPGPPTYTDGTLFSYSMISKSHIRECLSKFHFTKSSGVIFFSSQNNFPNELAYPAVSRRLKLRNLVDDLEKTPTDSSYIVFPEQAILGTAEPASPVLLPSHERILKLRSIAELYLNYLVGLVTGSDEQTDQPEEIENLRFLNRFIKRLNAEVLDPSYIKSSLSKFVRPPISATKTTRNRHTPIPNQIRKKMVMLHILGHTTQSQISALFNCSRSAVARAIKDYEAGGMFIFEEDCKRKKMKKLTPQIIEQIKLLVHDRKGMISGREISAKIKEKFNTQISLTTIFRAIKNVLNMSKRRGGATLGFSDTISSQLGLLKAVANFLDAVDRGMLPIYYDEASIELAASPRYAWVARGCRGPQTLSRRSPKLSLLLAICPKGVLAAELHSGSTTQIHVLEFLNEIFSHVARSPQLRQHKFFVFADNAAIHRTAYIFGLASLHKIPMVFNFAYSCFLNGIELAFNVIKAELRRLDPPGVYFLHFFAKKIKK